MKRIPLATALSMLNTTHYTDGAECKYLIKFAKADGQIVQRLYANNTKGIREPSKNGTPSKGFGYNLKETRNILMRDCVSNRPTSIYTKSIISIDGKYEVEL